MRIDTFDNEDVTPGQPHGPAIVAAGVFSKRLAEEVSAFRLA